MLDLIDADSNYARFFIGTAENKKARNILTSSLKDSIPKEEMNEWIEEQVWFTGTSSLIMDGPKDGNHYSLEDDKDGKTYAFYPKNPDTLVPGSKISINVIKLGIAILEN